MQTTRRGFLGGAAAFAPFAANLWAVEAEAPLLKIGVMTDTHVGTTKGSCARARLAYEMFRDMGVDLIANVGDVADHHYPTGYVAYREMEEETFAKVPAAKRPKELFVYAWHDAYAYKDHPREAATKDSPEAFADMEKLIGATNGPYAEGEIKGYPYVVIPQLYGTQGVDWRRFDKMLADAVASHPGKPVFVFAHQPPAGTTRSGRGIPKKRAVLNKSGDQHLRPHARLPARRARDLAGRVHVREHRLPAELGRWVDGNGPNAHGELRGRAHRGVCGQDRVPQIRRARPQGIFRRRAVDGAVAIRPGNGSVSSVGAQAEDAGSAVREGRGD